jgi:shikimate kinase
VTAAAAGEPRGPQATQAPETSQVLHAPRIPQSPGAPLVVLIGPPGAGKTEVGPLVAARLGVPFRDTDADVGAAAGKPVSDIFVENGEEAFRVLEREAVARALDEHGALREHGGVLALGSGAILDDQIRRLLEGLPVVYLSADFATIARRVGLDRPRVVVPGNPRGRLRAMLAERHPLYERLAAITVETDDLDVEEIADQIAGQVAKQITPGQAGDPR